MNSFTTQSHRAARANPRPRVRLLRLLCLIEAATLLLLLGVAVPLKHLAGQAAAVSFMGPIHGFVFLVFVWCVVSAAGNGTIGWRTGGKLMAAACLPFGGIYSWWSLR